MAIDRAYATYDFIWLCSNFEIKFAFIALEILNITKLKKSKCQKQHYTLCGRLGGGEKIRPQSVKTQSAGINKKLTVKCGVHVYYSFLVLVESILIWMESPMIG